jgi:hypothetical protein
MRSMLLGSLMTLVLATWSAAAVAQDATSVAESERHWYGGPILIADAAAFTLVVGSQLARLHTKVPIGFGLATFVLAPPVAHTLHGHWGRGLGSLGLRLGLPVLGGLALAGGIGTCHQDDDSCYAEGALLGALVGMGVAASVDQLTAFDRHETSAKPRALIVVPTLAVGRAGGSIGLAGLF